MRMRIFLRYAISIFCLAWLISILSHSAEYGPIDSFIPHKESQPINRILLLTAHPDDECMFFGPTINSLVSHSGKNNVILYSLCLSMGNSEGLGTTRQSELFASLGILGIPPSRAQVLDHPRLQDNITQIWNADLVANVVNDFINRHEINTVITFDDKGISEHPNHIALPAGVQHLREIARTDRPLRLFVLTTTSLIPKYTGAFAHVFSKIKSHTSLPFIPQLFVFLETDGTRDNNSAHSITFVSNLSSYITTFRAMLQHRSQLVWFRWLYLLFSRYMWVNDLVEVSLRHGSSIGR